jgi:hypothetical protein
MSAYSATRVTSRSPCDSGRHRSGRRHRRRPGLRRTRCGLIRHLRRGLDTRRHRRCRGRLGRSRWRNLRTAPGRRRRNLTLGQEEQRIEIPVRVVAPTHAEMDVRHRHLCRSARADRPNGGTLPNRVSSMHDLGPEVQQRHRVTVLALNRHGPAAARNGSGEGDGAADRSEHRRPCGRADVDTPVLPASVGVVAEQEGLQDGAVHGPGPAERPSREGQRAGDCGAEEQSSDQRCAS